MTSFQRETNGGLKEEEKLGYSNMRDSIHKHSDGGGTKFVAEGNGFCEAWYRR